MSRPFVPLSETNPELASQADGWDPAMVSARSSRRLKWRCERGHSWESTPGNRSRGTGCPVCANKVLLIGFNDLATVRPDIAAEADGWDPSTLIVGAAAKRQWKCSLGHTWLATLNKRVSAGRGCPYCAGQKVWVGFNDFATHHPELLVEVDGWDPTSVTMGSGVKQRWRCSVGHSYMAAPWNRSKGSGCPFCLSQAVLAGFNDFGSQRPELSSWVDGWDPTSVMVKSDKKMKWRCPSGHPFTMRVSNMANGAQCPVCLNDQIIPGVNDLATTHPEVAQEASGWDPRTVPYGSTKSRQWICSLGHQWMATCSSRTYMKSGCPFCAGSRALKGFNDLATLRPDLASEADGWDPSSVTVRAGSKKTWRCSEGHQWVARIADRSVGRGCPSCAQTGYDPNQQGWLYLIEHTGKALLQVGLTNFPADRLRKHLRSGWELLDLRGPMDGHLAQALETSILRCLKRRGVVMANTLDIRRFDGWSEAWRSSDLVVHAVIELLNLVYEDEA